MTNKRPNRLLTGIVAAISFLILAGVGVPWGVNDFAFGQPFDAIALVVIIVSFVVFVGAVVLCLSVEDQLPEQTLPGTINLAETPLTLTDPKEAAEQPTAPIDLPPINDQTSPGVSQEQVDDVTARLPMIRRIKRKPPESNPDFH